MREEEERKKRLQQNEFKTGIKRRATVAAGAGDQTHHPHTDAQLSLPLSLLSPEAKRASFWSEATLKQRKKRKEGGRRRSEERNLTASAVLMLLHEGEGREKKTKARENCDACNLMSANVCNKDRTHHYHHHHHQQQQQRSERRVSGHGETNEKQSKQASFADASRG